MPSWETNTSFPEPPARPCPTVAHSPQASGGDAAEALKTPSGSHFLTGLGLRLLLILTLEHDCVSLRLFLLTLHTDRSLCPSDASLAAIQSITRAAHPPPAPDRAPRARAAIAASLPPTVPRASAGCTVSPRLLSGERSHVVRVPWGPASPPRSACTVRPAVCLRCLGPISLGRRILLVKKSSTCVRNCACWAVGPSDGGLV